MANSEQSIRIKDLIFVVLRAWRQVIVFVVIGVVLFAGLAFYRGRISTSSSDQTVKLTDKIIEEVTQKAMQGDPEILERTDRKKSLASRSDYLSSRLANSVYLSIDEKAQPVVAFDVNMTPEQPSPDSEETYEQRQYFLGLEFLKIAKGEYLAEYLSSQSMRRVEALWIKELLTLQLDGKGVLHFEATAPELETTEKLAEAAEEFFTGIIREHIKVTYLFDISISNYRKTVEPNPAIGKERERMEEELGNVRLAIDQEQAAIELRIEEAVAQALEDGISQAENEQGANAGGSLKRSMLKYGLAGAFIGLLIVAFIAVFRATSSTLIWSPEEFADQLKLLYIGTIAVASPLVKKKFESGIDRWLESIFYKKRGVDEKENVHYVISVIEGLAGKEGTDPDVELPFTVAVMGEAEDSSMEMLVEAIKKLPLMLSVGVVADTAEGIKMLRSADAVVQLVQARRTSMRKAIHDLELAAGMGVKIHGIVGVELV